LVFAAVEHLGQFCEFVDYFEVFGVFFVFVDVGAAFEVFEESSENPHPFEEMRLKVKAVLLAESELIIVVVQTLLGHAYSFGSLHETDLLGAVAVEMEFSPLLDYFNDLENNSLLAPLLLH